jgi:hypothetical protein
MEMTEEYLETLYKGLILKKQEGTLDKKQEFLYLATGFALDLVDGDLNDYLFNETGNHVKALLEAFQELGAVEVHDLLKEALDQLSFTLPEDMVSRQAFMTEINQDVLTTWDALTEDYYDLEQEFWQLLGSYN